MIEFFKSLLKDKHGSYSLREFVSVLFVLIIIVSWIAHQFYGFEVPEFMFYAFVSIVFAGIFGYSIERKDKNNQL